MAPFYFIIITLSGSNSLRCAWRGACYVAWKRKARPGTGPPGPTPLLCLCQQGEKERLLNSDALLSPASQQRTRLVLPALAGLPFGSCIMPASPYSFLIYTLPLRICILRQQYFVSREGITLVVFIIV